MTTDQQVRLLMTLLKQGLPLVTAAAKAGMSERTARKYRRSGKAPSEVRVAHTWRTRADPFEGVWPEVEGLLEHDQGLQAKTVFEELVRRYPGRFQAGSFARCSVGSGTGARYAARVARCTSRKRTVRASRASRTSPTCARSG